MFHDNIENLGDGGDALGSKSAASSHAFSLVEYE